MWKQLWDDFAARAHRLRQTRAPLDAVDETILWQLNGDRTHCGAQLAQDELQLPEIYSGCPWQTSEHWIALITINPSMDANEIYPSLALYEELGASEELISFFERRFHARCARPLPHGRPPGHRSKPTSWTRGPLAAEPSTNNTWTTLDNLIRAAAERAEVDCGQAPLGKLAAIVDVVPWKFRAWGEARRDLQEDLLKLAAPYLAWWLGNYRPKLVVTFGASAWRGISAVFPVETAPGTDDLQRATVVRPDGHCIEVIRAPHFRPVAFNKARAPLIEAFAAALRG